MFRTTELIQHHTVGEQLRQARERMQLSVADVARRLSISAPYLVAIEKGRYMDLPSPVYTKNYIRLYANFVHVPWQNIDATLQQELRAYRSGVDTLLAAPTPAHHRKPLVIPSLIKFGALGFVLLLLAVYFIWEVVQFVSPPHLTVSTPPADTIVTDSVLTVSGTSDPEALVDINGAAVAVEPDGRFSEQVFLHAGLNTISISAKTTHSQPRVEVRNILYNTTSNN